MSDTKRKTYADFVLPSMIVTKADLSRLVSELESVDNELTAAAVRAKSGLKQNQLTISEGLTAFLQTNALQVGTDSHARTDLIKQLRLLKEKAPVVHMTFAVTADRESLQQLAQWLRTSINPQTLVSVGLQPGRVAGVYLRTPNHGHDLSLRAMLENGHDLLVKEIGALRGSN